VHEAIYCMLMMKNGFLAESANINDLVRSGVNPDPNPSPVINPNPNPDPNPNPNPHPNPNPKGASPRYAAAHASSEVVVVGGNLAPTDGSLLCRFDGDARTTVGRFLNGSAVACPTLPTEQGARDSSVSVSNDAGLRWSAPGVPFTYYEPERPPLLRSVSPQPFP